MPLAHGIGGGGDDDVSRRVSVSTLAAGAEISVLGDDVRHAPLGRRGAAHGDGTKKPYFPVSREKWEKRIYSYSHPDWIPSEGSGEGWGQIRRASLTFSRPITGLFNHTRTPPPTGLSTPLPPGSLKLRLGTSQRTWGRGGPDKDPVDILCGGRCV